MVVNRDDINDISFPIEDIDLIFVEDPNVLITSRLITYAAENGVSIIFCGPNFLPSSQTVPINGHYLQPNMLKLQLKLLPSKKNKFWEIIVKAKILNQMSKQVKFFYKYI